jgi:hypothetical protein
MTTIAFCLAMYGAVLVPSDTRFAQLPSGQYVQVAVLCTRGAQR